MKPMKNQPPSDIIKPRTRRPLSDSAGILNSEAVGAVRKAIEDSRTKRRRLDRERLGRLLAAFDPDETAFLEAVRLKMETAGLGRKEARELLDQVKKEHWRRRYGNKKSLK